MTKEGDMRVWWIPQLPSETPFHVPVETADEAAIILTVLANYDLYQLKHKIKPDYSNAGGLERYQQEEWSEYEDVEGRSIEEIMEAGD